MGMTTSAHILIDTTNSEDLPDRYWELVETYRGVLVNQAYSYLGNVDDAEDVVQETFCEAVRTPAKLAQAQSLSALLRTINKKNALNRLRKKKNESKSVRESQRRKRAFTTGGYTLIETRDWVAKEIETLSHQARMVMVLRYWEQKPFEEIAKRLRLPITSVWRLHQDCALKMYRKMGDQLGRSLSDQVPQNNS